MARRLVLDSPALQRAAATGFVRPLPSARRIPGDSSIYRRRSYVLSAQEIDLEQFRIVDASIYDSTTGAIITPRIKVIAGTDPNTTYSGSLNGLSYYCADPIELTAAATIHYVYAIDGDIYVLADQHFVNDIISSALIGMVKVNASSLTIIQHVVPLSVYVIPVESATSRIQYSISYNTATEKISVAYSYHGTYITNGAAMSADFTLAVGDMVILGYVETLLIGINDNPVTGTVIQNYLDPKPVADYVTTILSYQWDSTTSSEFFHLRYRQEQPRLDTFISMTQCNCIG